MNTCSFEIIIQYNKRIAVTETF